MRSRSLPLLDRCRKAALALGWSNPFFLMPLARCQWREDATGFVTRGTFAVTADGVIYAHKAFADTLDDQELQGVIAHEVMHVLMNHFFRRADRDPIVWNVATDMAINYALRRSNIRLPKGALMPPAEWEGWHAERIYAELMTDVDKARQKASKPQQGEDGTPRAGVAGQDQAQAPVGQGCGPLRPDQGASDPSEARARDAEIERGWREAAAAAKQITRNVGDGRGDALVAALEVPEPRVRWSAVLRQGTAMALQAHGRDSQTWSRRGRRSQAVGAQFPGWHATDARVAIVIDTSGSMSDDDLAQCVAESVEIARNTGVAIYLVTHDDGVQWEGWLSPSSRPEKFQAALKGRGGTCAREAYDRVGKATRRFDAMIHLTDGWLAWPEWPANVRKPIVALAGYGSAAKDHVRDGAVVVEVGAQ